MEGDFYVFGSGFGSGFPRDYTRLKSDGFWDVDGEDEVVAFDVFSFIGTDSDVFDLFTDSLADVESCTHCPALTWLVGFFVELSDCAAAGRFGIGNRNGC